MLREEGKQYSFHSMLYNKIPEDHLLKCRWHSITCAEGANITLQNWSDDAWMKLNC